MEKEKLKLFLGLLAVTLLPARVVAQDIIPPQNDSTFVSEFRDDRPWAVIAKNGFVVGLGNKVVKDDYGSYYQITILIQNLSGSDYTFVPDSIYATLKDRYNETVRLNVYTNEAYQKKVRRSQAWAAALYGLAAGMNAASAGYQTSYVATTGYGGYTYIQPVTTYNYAAASLANMQMSTQLMMMGKQMEADRKIREEGYLKKNTIHYGEGIFGYMNIKRVKGKTMQIVIPLNGTDYVFNWNVEKAKKSR